MVVGSEVVGSAILIGLVGNTSANRTPSPLYYYLKFCYFNLPLYAY